MFSRSYLPQFIILIETLRVNTMQIIHLLSKTWIGWISEAYEICQTLRALYFFIRPLMSCAPSRYSCQNKNLMTLFERTCIFSTKNIEKTCKYLSKSTKIWNYLILPLKCCSHRKTRVKTPNSIENFVHE